MSAAPDTPTSPEGAGKKVVKRVGNFELGRMLGSGSFSKVREAVDVTSGKLYAVKVIEKAMLAQQHLEAQLHREITIMKDVRHANVVELVQVLRTSHNIYIVLELVDGGELYDFLQQSHRLDEPTARHYFRQLVAGLAYVHAMGIAHRDLKPENLLLTRDKVLKISDFGLANLQAMTDTGTVATRDYMHTRCGTPSYVAPEVLTEPGYNGFRADIWSAGVILFFLLSGRLPFVAPDIHALYRKIQTADYRMSSAVPPQAADLISKILVVAPSERATLRDIYRHAWVQEGMTAAEREEFDAVFAATAAPAPIASPRGSPSAAASAAAGEGGGDVKLPMMSARSPR